MGEDGKRGPRGDAGSIGPSGPPGETVSQFLLHLTKNYFYDPLSIVSFMFSESMEVYWKPKTSISCSRELQEIEVSQVQMVYQARR